MKIYIYVVISLFIFSYSYSQTDTININNTYDTSQTIYTFNPPQTIYGLRINGSITYDDYTSVARVILVNNDSTELLIYEAYPWLYNNSNWAFYFSDAGDETYFLDTLDAAYIKVEIVNAKIDISTMLIDTTYSSNIPALRELYIDSLRQIKIDSINNNIQSDSLLWLAGDNDVAQMSFYDKKKIFSNDSILNNQFNTFGFEYYSGGIFSKIGVSLPVIQQSNLLDDFDWRNRHGQNWISQIKDQGQTQFCTWMAYNAVLEAIINLYYNSVFNISLSEQAFHSCMYTIYRQSTYDQWFQSYPPSTLSCNTPCQYTKIGAIETSCYPLSLIEDHNGYTINNDKLPAYVWIFLPPYSTYFPNWGDDYYFCKNLCQNYEYYIWKAYDYDNFANYQPNIDLLKEKLIKQGPCTIGYNGHMQSIIGFHKIKLNDVWEGNVIDVSSPFLGQTFWIEKNSYGTNWGNSGFGFVIHDFCTYNSSCPHSFTSLLTPIKPSINSNLYDTDIRCTDTDGDGYYWWGIGSNTPPSTCPTFTPLEADCDDSDNLLGHFDTDYSCTEICVFDNIWTEVTGSNLTIDVNTYITTNIRVKSGYTLKIESGASLYIHPSTHFIVESGGILQLESGNIKICSDVTWQGSLTVETGGQMLIEGTCVIEINN